jgi:hypothetical protein
MRNWWHMLGGGWWRRRHERRAVEQFHSLRTRLQQQFEHLAGQLGKPRGLRWLACDWQPEVVFARDRQSGALTALVAVNIRFEAIPGGEMEHVDAVGLLREASAVFHYHRGRWGTGGRALFNMGPTAAMQQLAAQYDLLDVSPSDKARP